MPEREKDQTECQWCVKLAYALERVLPYVHEQPHTHHSAKHNMAMQVLREYQEARDV